MRWNGKEQHIPPHCDKSVSKESQGREEDFAPIYNTSFLAVRPFTITTLELIEAWKESKGAVDIAPYVLKAIPMRTGDLVRLTPLLNTSTAHMVPKDPSITELRISLVFRHCDKRWVKLNEYHFDMVQRGRGNQKRWEKGRRIRLPEPDAEPPAEEKAAASAVQAPCAGEEDSARYLPSVASWWLPLPTTPAESEEQTEGNQPATTAAPASKRMRI